MELVGIRVIVAPDSTATALGFLLAGVLLGTISGLTPGLHANTFAVLLVALAPSIPGPPVLVGVTMLTAGVVHTFLDVVPALALGVPDAAMAATALPGHQLVIEGRGREALRLSALGSGLAVLLAIPLAWPVTAAMVRLYPILRPYIPILLAALAVGMIVSESTRRSQLGAGLSFMLAAGLGVLTLDLPTDGVLDAGGMLAPLFAGLFGAPVLLDAIGGGGVPPQDDPGITMDRGSLFAAAFGGTAAGAIVGYLPGVSSAIAAVAVLALIPAAAGARGFLVATSGVNTANTVFALLALVALGTPRTGVMVALNDAGVPLNLPLLLSAVGIAAAVSFPLVIYLGDPYLRVVGSVDYTRLSLALLAGLVGLAYLVAGPIGIGAFVAGGLIGLVPPRTGARRVHCMGVLIGPIILAG